MASMSREDSGLRFTLSVGSLEPETFVVSGFTLHEQFSTPFRGLNPNRTTTYGWASDPT